MIVNENKTNSSRKTITKTKLTKKLQLNKNEIKIRIMKTETK